MKLESFTESKTSKVMTTSGKMLSVGNRHPAYIQNLKIGDYVRHIAHIDDIYVVNDITGNLYHIKCVMDLGGVHEPSYGLYVYGNVLKKLTLEEEKKLKILLTSKNYNL